MEKTHRDRLRMLGMVQIFVVLLMYLLAAYLISQSRQQEGNPAYLLSFLTAFFPILLLLGILGFAALAGRSWGFPLSAATAIFLFGYAVFSVMYWNFLRGKET